jgi:L-fucose isomerase-like protein
MKKTTFALYFGNRGFFPGELVASAREKMVKVCEENGYGYLIMDETLTRYGAIETIEEGRLYANFLEEHKGEYDGIILCLPNFGDENGASVALKDVDVPILIQAIPDDMNKMDFAHRADTLAGKLAICNVLRQMKVKYTLTKEMCVDPLSDSFKEDLRLFAGTCRVVTGMRKFNVGAIGARTTAFKTVRFDEIAFQSKRVNIETIDMTMVFDLMDAADPVLMEAKKQKLLEIADFGTWPAIKLENLARLGVAIDKLIADYDLQAIAIRCWNELQLRYGIAPCVLLGELNERGIAAACELDVTNAVMMRAMGLAANWPVVLLDVNNNYNDDMNKGIFFHCGPAPISMMEGKGTIEQHLMFKKSYGDGSGVGINVGELIKGDVTVGSFKTEDGDLCAFVTEGKFTNDEIPEEFFGMGVVFEKENANEMFNYMARNGYRHHAAITKGNYAESVREAFDNYLGYKIDVI